MATSKLSTKSPIKKSSETKKDSILKKNLKSFVGQVNLAAKIQEKAYELYLKRGGSHGNDLQDWYDAEQMVRSEGKS